MLYRPRQDFGAVNIAAYFSIIRNSFKSELYISPVVAIELDWQISMLVNKESCILAFAVDILKKLYDCSWNNNFSVSVLIKYHF